MALLTKIGYGQVEPNHLSAQRTGQIFAQLPAHADTEVLENGMFVKYDYANGVCNATGAGNWMLVYNEIKLYDKARQGYKDFALKSAEAVDDVIVPRVFAVNDSDIFTTNEVDMTTGAGSRKGLFVVPTRVGSTQVAVLTEKTTPVASDEVYQVVAETTMPDGQYALKIRRLYTLS